VLAIVHSRENPSSAAVAGSNSYCPRIQPTMTPQKSCNDAVQRPGRERGFSGRIAGTARHGIALLRGGDPAMPLARRRRSPDRASAGLPRRVSWEISFRTSCWKLRARGHPARHCSARWRAAPRGQKTGSGQLCELLQPAGRRAQHRTVDFSAHVGDRFSVSGRLAQDRELVGKSFQRGIFQQRSAGPPPGRCCAAG